MRRYLPPAVLAIVWPIAPAISLAATANRIELVRQLGPGWWQTAKELNEIELSLIDTQQAAPPAATAVQSD